VIRIPDISDTLKDEGDKDGEMSQVDVKAKAEARIKAAKGSGAEDSGGGATLLLLGHRRLRKTATLRHQPMVVQVDHLKDPKVTDRDDDDVLKATANEVIATIKDLLKVNPLAKETLQYFRAEVPGFPGPRQARGSRGVHVQRGRRRAPGDSRHPGRPRAAPGGARALKEGG
jgi:Lon-like ATP-dependent protease